MEAARDLAENDFMVAMDVRGQAFRSALSAFDAPVPPPTDEQVERLAAWLWSIHKPDWVKSSTWGNIGQMEKEGFLKQARAILQNGIPEEERT